MRFELSIFSKHSFLMLILLLSVADGAKGSHVFPYIDIQKAGPEYQITVGELPLHYFHFQHSTDLRQFSTIGASLGTPAPTFGYLPGIGETRGFFRAEAVSAWSPADVDQDGMDDLWELLNGLDPLDPADAGQPSTPHPGMTNLEAYRFRFGLTRVTEFYSVETSVFNSTFAISEEVSVYSFPNSTGFSMEALSAETSVFNFPAASGPVVEAVSVEVSVFNTAVFTGPNLQAVSPEVSIFNSFVVTPALQAVSLEVSVLKSLP